MQHDFRRLEDVGDLRGRRVLLRLDLNVPISGGAVRSEFRLHKSLPTVLNLRQRGAKVLIIGHREPASETLAPVIPRLREFFPVSLVPTIEAAHKALESAKEGSLVLLENVRNNPGESKNDPLFAKRLASLGDAFVNEAFSASHRAHASIVGVPLHIPAAAGFLFAEEVRHLSEAFNPPRPFLFILGGAKFGTKRPLIEKFLKAADAVFVAGALANDFFKAEGYETGRSLLSPGRVSVLPLLKNKKLRLPPDVVVEANGRSAVKAASAVLQSERIVDAGPKAISALSRLIASARFIMWNGPLGNYEDGFGEGTSLLARALASTPARVVVGGADTIAAIAKPALLSSFWFTSTGGGAMLEFLAEGTLPGIRALEENVRRFPTF